MKLCQDYIMSNKTSRVIYVGVTDNLMERVKEHNKHIQIHLRLNTIWTI
jgi:predicted GIY-YIG superfamily endonuclease